MNESASGPATARSSLRFACNAVPSGEDRRAPLRTGLIAAFLLMVGVSEPAAFLANLPGVRAIARMSSASNCPLVFNQVGGIEFWASEYQIEFLDQNGSSVVLPVTREVLSRISGPHTRTAAYVVPIGLGTVGGPALYRPPLRYGLCHRGPLARDLGSPEHLASATIRIRSGSPNDDREWALTFACNP